MNSNLESNSTLDPRTALDYLLKCMEYTKIGSGDAFWIPANSDALVDARNALGSKPNEPRFPIGTQYKPSGKNARLCTVVDHHTTFDSKGGVVKFRYVVTSLFCGQEMRDADVCETTVAIGVDRLAKEAI